MVGSLSGHDTVSLQVKTSSGARREYTRHPEKNHWEWTVGKKAIELEGPSIFYAFVDLKWKPAEIPDVFIVPSKDVASFFSDPECRKWSMHVFWLYDRDRDKFRESWHLITDRLKAADTNLGEVKLASLVESVEDQ